MQDLGYTLGQDSSNQRHQATEEESQTFSQWFGNRRPRAWTDVKRGLLAWCLTSDFPHFVFGLIQLACGQFGSIIPVLMGSFSWCCGFGNWVYPPLSCSTWPNCQAGACVLVVQCSLYHFRVVLHTFSITPSPSLALEAVPSHYFPSPFLFPFPTLFFRVCVGCSWGRGAFAPVHMPTFTWAWCNGALGIYFLIVAPLYGFSCLCCHWPPPPSSPGHRPTTLPIPLPPFSSPSPFLPLPIKVHSLLFILFVFCACS